MKNKKNLLLPVSVQNLSYTKGEKKLLNKVFCKISSKGITVVVGPNGAGKTLFLKCLHGIIKCNLEKVLFAGKPLNKKIRLMQSMVFQSPILMRRSVINNLLFVINQRKINIKRNEVMSLLKKVDLLHLAKEQAIVLSGGEKQRLSVARAIITSPKILFLDEATSNLDPYSVNIIEKIIKEVNKKGTKVIAVTHDLSQARRLASEIIFFNKGSISEHTKASSFFDQPKSSEGKIFISGKLVV